MLQKPTSSEERISSLKLRKDELIFETDMQFLKQHNGFRPKSIHLLIGTPGGGKSTFRNTIIFDFIKNNTEKKILLWLSEETLEDFENDLADNPLMVACCKNLVIFSEQDSYTQVSSVKNKAEFICENIIKSQCDLFIFDNITTSQCYGASFEAQDSFSNSFKSLLTKTKSSALLLAHTGSSIKEGYASMIDQNDIRGSKSIVNISQFLYVLQGFHIEKNLVNTIKIIKHRSYTPDSKIFMFKFNKKNRIYDFDVEVSFAQFNKLYQKQNRFKKL